MKKLICLLLVVFLLISMCACGAKKDEIKENNNDNDNNKEDVVEAPNMEEVFEAMGEYLLADAAAFGSDYVFDAYGVKAEDCKQQVVVSYYDGAATAEIWLIEAVNEDALAAIEEKAQARLTSMCEQFKSYDAKAYALAEDAQLITEGNCLVLIVSENADELMEIYKG